MANVTVTVDQAKSFAKVWDNRGIKMLLDATSMEFAKDFANMALRSALSEPGVRIAIFQEVYAEIKAKQTVTPTPPAPPVSKLVLTDAP